MGVIRADDLDHAVELQNATAYGLTGGLHSLDDEEIERWLARVEVGNAYVNRSTMTELIVRRQPFGGWKRSSVGGGAGPAVRVTSSSSSASATVPGRLGDGFVRRRLADQVLSRAHDPTGLACEQDLLRYRPLHTVAVRHDGTIRPPSTSLRAASRTTGVCSSNRS
ncbi:MAG: aldehyde dehydrogenase family protein [Ilumatobacteraceae bacterium]